MYLEKRFEKYLIEQGYKKTTPSGHPSTVYAYIKSINNICEWENITINSLADNIGRIVSEYDIGGAKEEYGYKSHNTVINALKSFERFVEHFDLSISKNETEDSKEIESKIIEVIQIPAEYRKKSIMSSNMYYDVLELYQDKIVGYMNKKKTMTFYFSAYDTVAFSSNRNQTFSEINFYRNVNWKKTQSTQRYRAIREFEMATIHAIRFYGGFFNSSKTDMFAKGIANKIMDAYDNYMIDKGL